MPKVGHERITIDTAEGTCPAHLFAPTDGGEYPAILFFMDAGGVRPAVLDMAERLAAAGYVVLLPDLFYRYGAYGPFDPRTLFQGDVMAVLGPLIASTGNAKAAEDVDAFLACLDARSDVAGPVGAVGFCMGGGMAIAAAGTRPDRLAAVACFHAGNLATDAPDSPHLFAPRLDAELYLAVAENDASYPPAMADRFEAALQAAHVAYHARTFPAAHGWMKPDFPVYDNKAAEEGWRDLLSFVGRMLRRS